MFAPEKNKKASFFRSLYISGLISLFFKNIIYKHSPIIADINNNNNITIVSLLFIIILNNDDTISPKTNPESTKERLLNFFFIFASSEQVLYLFSSFLIAFFCFKALIAMKIARI